jgi:vacuolar-type H+-ATPase subunit I/STV1
MENQVQVVSSEVQMKETSRKYQNRKRNHQSEAYKAKKAKRTETRKKLLIYANGYLNMVKNIVEINVKTFAMQQEIDKLQALTERTEDQQQELETLVSKHTYEVKTTAGMVEQRNKLYESAGEKWISIAARLQQ